MTQMPQLTMSHDVANRMTTSNHATAGTQSYGYNHANQRAQTSRCGSVRNGNTVTYYLYGLGGERLMEFPETCTSGACTIYTETQRWIHFAGRKMFQKTGTTLKAITPNRLASEAKHFPYGETDGPPPADTKDYFATYRRDTTGLDYAWNRYYSPTMGRFTTADPYEASAALTDPQTWNRYAYVANNPIMSYDPPGLIALCPPGTRTGPDARSCVPIAPPLLPGGGLRDRDLPEPEKPVEDTTPVEPPQAPNWVDQLIEEALTDAFARLATNDNCASLFGKSKNSISALGASSPAGLVGVYARNGWITYGSSFVPSGGGDRVDFSSLPGRNPKMNVGGVTTYGNGNCHAESGVVVSVNLIAMNVDSFAFPGMVSTRTSNGFNQLVHVTNVPGNAFYNVQLTQSQILSSPIIHELLHAVAAIPSDHNNSARSMANQSAVLKNCF